jgi:hypothetical protein
MNGAPTSSPGLLGVCRPPGGVWDRFVHNKGFAVLYIQILVDGKGLARVYIQNGGVQSAALGADRAAEKMRAHPSCVRGADSLITKGLRFCIYKYWLMIKDFQVCIYKRGCPETERQGGVCRPDCRGNSGLSREALGAGRWALNHTIEVFKMSTTCK